ncbi:Probable sulfate transporter Rv1739c/MT1781 [Serratia fonticola]|uniref:Probable sulfate transporter Rv1739c/MT1781 n=1 Tax=Serratia fonticola TaxID=47917 RepID=A0A4U9WAP4_SERFO|nr:Probable sulfate transporter Rv1739c/MT1781 [Serratia fonticola]
MSLLTLLILLGVHYTRPNWPAPLFAVVLTTALTWRRICRILALKRLGGYTGGGLPMVSWPNFKPGLLRDLVIPALNLAVVSFVSMMLTTRSFAAKKWLRS